MIHSDAVNFDVQDNEFCVMNEETNEVDVLEAEYCFSYTAEKLNELKQKNLWFAYNQAINSLFMATKEGIAEYKAKAPLGLADVSLIARMDQKQFAYANTVIKFFKDNEPILFKRLFKDEKQKDYLMFNVSMALAIKGMDEIYCDEKGTETDYCVFNLPKGVA